MLVVSHFNLIFYFNLTFLKQAFSSGEANHKQKITFAQQREGKIMFTHPQTIWHPKKKILCCCFVRVMQVSIKLSIICLTEFSQDVQTQCYFVVATREILCLSQKIHVSVFFRFGRVKKPSEASRHEECIAPSESFIMLNQVQAFHSKHQLASQSQPSAEHVNIFRC